MPRAAVEPVRIKQHDQELGCERLRVVGFRGRCGEHWLGARRDTFAEAVTEAIEHNRSEHAP
jgi:hypothetical protein